jgi:hypothetical protein
VAKGVTAPGPISLPLSPPAEDPLFLLAQPSELFAVSCYLLFTFHGQALSQKIHGSCQLLFQLNHPPIQLALHVSFSVSLIVVLAQLMLIFWNILKARLQR